MDLQARLDRLGELGLTRRMRRVSGPQGPRVVLDGRPVLLLCSSNYLGLADHPRVREAAADAAMRWGVGAGSARVVAGTMTIHRRLEEALAELVGTQAALLHGSGYLANLSAIATLTGSGEAVFCDELAHPAMVDACRLSRARSVAFRHGDVEHLAWQVDRTEAAGGMIVTPSVFPIDGDVAPLAELCDLARARGLRLVVDESHAIGTTGPGGRGLVAGLGLQDEVDVIVGSLGKALGAAGGFAACDSRTARLLVTASRPFAGSSPPPPPVAAAALAALELLVEQPRRVERLQANAGILRDALAREGFDVTGSTTQIVPLAVGDARTAARIVELALRDGVFAEAVRPPAVPHGAARLRLSVMASHTRGELRDAAGTLARAALAAGFRPGAGMPVIAAQGVTDEHDAVPLARAA
jgi:glycine C-acetyltransferase/8-amino-7-oxononanoate synthase